MWTEGSRSNINKENNEICCKFAGDSESFFKSTFGEMKTIQFFLLVFAKFSKKRINWQFLKVNESPDLECMIKECDLEQPFGGNTLLPEIQVTFK